MMIGAARFHLRGGDRVETLPSVVVIVVAVLYLITISSSRWQAPPIPWALAQVRPIATSFCRTANQFRSRRRD